MEPAPWRQKNLIRSERHIEDLASARGTTSKARDKVGEYCRRHDDNGRMPLPVNVSGTDWKSASCRLRELESL